LLARHTVASDVPPPRPPPPLSSPVCVVPCTFSLFFFFNDPATTEIYTLSLHDALPISTRCWLTSVAWPKTSPGRERSTSSSTCRSEEHTSELQSLTNLVCRLLLEKKKRNYCCIDITESPTARYYHSHYVTHSEHCTQL